MRNDDTELKQRWELVQKDESELRQRLSAAGCPPDVKERLANCLHTQELIRRDWESLLAERRRGKLTDTTRTDAVEKSIKDYSRLLDIPTVTKVIEGERDEFYLARRWHVAMRYAGELGDFDKRKWDRFLQKVDEELKQFPFVVGPRFEKWDFEIFGSANDDDSAVFDDSFKTQEDDYDDDETEELEEDQETEYPPMSKEDEAKYYSGIVSLWTVDTWPWSGPPTASG